MDMVKVRRHNRILEIPEGRLNAYLEQGYDQIDEEGNVVRRATGGRTISVAEYNKVVDELERLKNTDAQKELEEAKKEIKALKAENTKLKKALEETTKSE
jgi:cell shape-determining protein MreC